LCTGIGPQSDRSELVTGRNRRWHRPAPTEYALRVNVSQLNHVALHVADVERSRRFYVQTLRLKPIPRPAFSFPGFWFRIGTDQELHLIGDRNEPVHSHHRGNHFALRVSNIAATQEWLRECRAEFSGPSQRPDGAWQIFLVDPDGHCIELCELPDGSP
jgi:lactoylglutathione lyase